MKKLLAILILMSMIFAFTVSCRSSDKNNKENKQDAENNEEVEEKEDYKPEKRIFTVIGTLAESEQKHEDVVSSVEIGLNTKKVTTEFSELKGKTKKFPGKDDTFVYRQSSCTLKANEVGKYGSFYCIYDEYVNQNGSHESFMVLHGSDTVAFYSNIGDKGNSADILSEEEIKESAESFLSNIMTDEEFSEFTLSQYESSGRGFWALRYDKILNGYKTDETISIFVYSSGKIMGYNAYNLKKYDFLESKITEKALDEARDALNEKLASMKLENLQTHDPCIITNSEGKVFLEMKFSYDHPDGYAATSSLVTNVI